MYSMLTTDPEYVAYQYADSEKLRIRIEHISGIPSVSLTSNTRNCCTCRSRAATACSTSAARQAGYTRRSRR